DTEEKRKIFTDFFSGPAHLQKNLALIDSIIKHLKEDEAESIGIFGFCWGGKLSVLCGASYANEIKSVAMIHPAMVDPNDAHHLKVPICSLISKDEVITDCDTFENIVKTKSFSEKCVFKTFNTMHHGFMAARSDLTNNENIACFREGVHILKTFFLNTL
ncbi:hypothetical protein PCK2_001022, partial [Pneumocystis canis]